MANVEKFKYWCNKILPLVYDDSLSYYEFLGKVYEKLNETIDAVNSNTEAVAEFDQRINDFIAAETAARESWEDQQERDRQSWETTETANRAEWERQQELKWSAFQAMFIAEYDPDEAYVQGDLCSVQYKMYVANASTTGTFDPTKWDEIVLSDYLADYVADAKTEMQGQYDAFLANYQRTFGIVDCLGGSPAEAISQRSATEAIHSADFQIPGGPGDINGKIYSYIDGSLINASTVNTGNLIPCRAGQIIYGFVRHLPSATPFDRTSITFWDNNEDFVVGLQANGNSFTVPNNSSIRFVRVPYNNTRGENYLAVTFWPVTTNPPHYYDLHTVKAEVDQLKAATDGAQWNGKTWYAYGTSITSTEMGHYVTPLAAMLGATVVNKGIGGGGIGDFGAYSRGQVYSAICNTTDGKLNADLITLETGANDTATGVTVPLGTIYDTGTTTLAGCLNDCLRYLQTNTTAQIVVTISPAIKSAPGSGQYWEWLQMVEQICKINCVAFIPNETNMGYATLNSSHGSDYVIDIIHQTELGGYVFAENMFRYLKNIPTFKTSVPNG